MRAILLLAVFAVGCASPTAPTAVSAPVVAAVDPDTLRWDLIAPGCTVAKPVPMLTATPPTSRMDTPTGIRGLWLISVDGRRSTYIEGHFQRVGSSWALCSWDTVVREVIS